MKYISHEHDDGLPVVELTRRNLEALLAKLDDPLSYRTLVDADFNVVVRAVEDSEHYKTRPPGEVYLPSDDRWV